MRILLIYNFLIILILVRKISRLRYKLQKLYIYDSKIEGYKMNKNCIKILTLIFFGIMILPIKTSFAASESCQFHNIEGTRFTLKATINSVYPNDGENNIQFEATLNELRSDAYDVHDLYVSFRISSYDTGTTGLTPLSYVGDYSFSSAYFSYNSEWGEVSLQISVEWKEDIPLTFDPVWSSIWTTFFTLKPGNFLAQNYYIFIIMGVAIIAITVGISLFNRKNKQSQSTNKTTYPEAIGVQKPAPKQVIYCSNCGTYLKERLPFCPDCGAKL